MVGIISKFTSDSSDPLLHVAAYPELLEWPWILNQTQLAVGRTHNLRCIISLVFGVAFSLLLGAQFQL